MAHPRHEEVRERYGRCCGYCGVSETETGGELTIDHFRPVSASGDDSADNLVYACFRCNALTASGGFHLFLLRLNRPQLVARRLTRRLGHLFSEAYRLLQSENERLQVRVVLLETYMREVIRQRIEETESEGQESS
jgi:hypothetical protein